MACEEFLIRGYVVIAKKGFAESSDLPVLYLTLDNVTFTCLVTLKSLEHTTVTFSEGSVFFCSKQKAHSTANSSHTEVER